MSYSQATKELRSYANPKKSLTMANFFKTKKGQYGAGDIFLGLVVAQTRLVSKKFAGLSLKDIKRLLLSKIHEERLLSLFILVDQFEKGDEALQKKLFNFYMKNSKKINNWDLVDTSAPSIAGKYLLKRDKTILYKMARSKNLWQKRIAIVSTYTFIKNKDYKHTFKISEILIKDNHDLIHKACGWMLREVGKKVGEIPLKDFLDRNTTKMPRTMLRYAIERFPPSVRKFYLNKR